MRILLIADSIQQGGVGRVASILSDYFSSTGNTVSILLMAQDRIQEGSYIKNDNIALKFLSAEAGTANIRPMLKLQTMRRIIAEDKSDVAIAFINEYCEYAVLATRFLHTKVIVGEVTDPHVSPKNKILRFLRSPLYGLADRVVLQTEDMMSFFPKYVQGKSQIIFNPISPDLPEPYVGIRRKCIVSVGRLNELKNFQMGILAFSNFHRSHPEYTYEIYGEGPYRSSLEELIRAQNLESSVFLKGHDGSVLDKIRDASIFVMPSNYEGMSNALIEALAIGIPCISTDHPVGAARMLIQSGTNGILIPVGDTNALFEAMNKIVDNACLAMNLADEAIKLRNKLAVEKIAGQWMDCCKLVLKRKGKNGK